MLKWLKEAISVGDATVKYPFAPLDLIPDSRGKPVHDALACIACGACATACPPNAIQMELDLCDSSYVWKIDYGRCIFCGRCEEVCPVQAIELTQEFELAVMSKADLVETARYRIQGCRVCKKPYAPRKEIAYLSKLLANCNQQENGEVTQAQELLNVCPLCRRKTESDTVRQISSQLERRA